jgi:hypothetical protein
MLSDSQRSHITKCKISLYVALLDIPVNEMNDWDAEIGYALASDPDIQAALYRDIKKEVNNDNN